MAEKKSLLATIHGKVQGVYFRNFVQTHARTLGLTGYVRNMPDGRSVQVVAEGERGKLEELTRHLNVGPAGANVDTVETVFSDYTGSYENFSISY
ncbi:MAG: acylphosphatase [Dehalococcoidia bacterium]